MIFNDDIVHLLPSILLFDVMSQTSNEIEIISQNICTMSVQIKSQTKLIQLFGTTELIKIQESLRKLQNKKGNMYGRAK